MGNPRVILICAALGLLLSGCALTHKDVDYLFSGDTVVNIPLKPEATTAPTADITPSEPPETAPEAASLPDGSEPVPTVSEPAPAATSGSSKSSSAKSSTSKKNSGSTQSKATVPSATQPPTLPVSTESMPTEPSPLETDPPESEPFQIYDYSAGDLEYAVVEQINALRTEAGIGELAINHTLCGIAALRASEIRISWSHTRPNGSDWQTVLRDYGFPFGTAAEALVHTAGFDAASIVRKWTENTAIRESLLSDAFRSIGVGICASDETILLAAILVD